MASMRADPTAAEAMSLLLRGDIEAGLRLYRKTLKVGQLSDSPVGIHLLFLREAGKTEAEARLLELALEQGANVALKAGGLGCDPGEAAAEYEALFARGIANSRIVFEYLKVLAELGRWDDHRRMLGRERLLRQVRLDRPVPGGAGTLHAAVAGLLRELEPRSEHQESVQSVRKMRMLEEFSMLEHPTAKGLMMAISHEATSYVADWRSCDHPLASLVPQNTRLDAWGLISRGKGFNIQHIHSRAWVSGVYYPIAVDAGAGGELVIGRPDGAAGTDEDWGTTCVRPEAGLLVMMPSYFTHWTNPLVRRGRRMSVAFDLCRTGKRGEQAVSWATD